MASTTHQHVMLAAARRLASALGGIRYAAAVVGKCEGVMAHELAADGSAKLGAVTWLELAALDASHGVVRAACSALGGVFLPTQAPRSFGDGAVDLMAALRQLADVAAAHSAAMQATVHALADGQVSANELAQIEAAALQAMASQSDLLGAVRAMHAQRAAA